MASKQDGAQPVVWLRSETLGEEKAFSPTHAARLQALEARQGKPDWLPMFSPPPAATSPTLLPPKPADDPKPRKRTAAARKPRQRRGD